jgi:hypothetical protein
LAEAHALLIAHNGVVDRRIGGRRELYHLEMQEEMERAAEEHPLRPVRPSLRRYPADTVGVAMPQVMMHRACQAPRHPLAGYW